MGREIAWRRFPLTSATGAATVSQPQCRDAPQSAGLEFDFFFLTFKEKEVQRKDFESKNGKEQKRQ